MIDLNDITQPLSKRFKIKQRITHLLHITSAHGFSRLLKSKNNILTTLMWLFFLISSNLISNLIETSKNDNGLTRFRSYDQVNKHFIGIRVYYRQLKYTIISQTPKLDLFSLVSQIGDNFGLFWGISFLSFVELIEIFFEIIFILILD